MTPTVKAGALVAVCAAVAVWSWSLGTVTETVLPYALFYALLLVQTFFSVKLFQTLAPSTDIIQMALDAILVVLYIALALALHTSIAFPFLMTLFFSIAVLKYALMLGNFPRPALLRRKIYLNQLGVLLCLLITLGVYTGYAVQSACTLVTIFAVATAYLFFVNPLYRL